MANVSVIIPIYNTEKYIERCAVSLFEQTLDDIEYIFISDCSPDNSIAILKRTLEKYPKRYVQTKILEMPCNSGVAAVRKYGISIASGDYIANCDSDDWVDSDMYSTMYEYAVNNQCDIVRCKFVRCNEALYQECHPLPRNIYSTKDTYISSLLGGNDLNSLCDKLVKRTLFINNNIIYPKFHMYEDNVLNIQLAYYSNRIGYIDNAMYYYYINSNSICNKNGRVALINRMNQKRDNVDIIISFLKGKNIYDRYYKEIAGLKYDVREDLQSIITQKGILNLWRNTYPELCFNDLPNCRLKFKYLLNITRLSFFIRIYRHLKSRLLHK